MVFLAVTHELGDEVAELTPALELPIDDAERHRKAGQQSLLLARWPAEVLAAACRTALAGLFQRALLELPEEVISNAVPALLASIRCGGLGCLVCRCGSHGEGSC